MNSVAVCTTNQWSEELKELAREKIGEDVDFFEPLELKIPEDYTPNDSVRKLIDGKELDYYWNLRTIGYNVRLKEVTTRSYYKICFLMNEEFLRGRYKVQLPSYIEENTLFYLPEPQKHLQNSAVVDKSFFFADTITFNVSCDAFRFLKLNLGKFCKGKIDHYFYTYLKMCGIRCYPGVDLENI